MEMRTLMVFAFLVGAALAGPISWDDSKCALKCSSTPNKFRYESGKTYIYGYESENEIQLTDSTGDKVSVQMTARVEIGVLSDCEMILQLREVSLSDSEDSRFVVFKQALEARPMPFSFEDGVIQHVCPSPEDKDNEYVLNIKRAIVSSFQNTAPNHESKQTVQETDISGVCETEYEPSKGWASLTIIKTKDLKSCSRRLNSPISSFSTPYSIDSSLQSLPLVSGEQRCEQVINNGLIKNIKCNEKTIFSPFSRNGKGIAVETDISLAHIETQNGVNMLSQRISDRSTLLFAPNPKINEESNERDARQVLTDLCESTRDGVTSKTPFKVGKLISVLRGLPVDRISRIYESLDSNQLCPSQIVQDIFVDALSMAGTKGPVKFMAKLVQENKISSIRSQAWFTLLAFNQNADSESIRALVPFLKKNSEFGGRQAILGISSFIYNFCQDDSIAEDCREDPAVKEALSALKEQLNSNCRAESEEEENLVVLALAGFENIGRVGEAREIIKECFAQKSNSNLIRHAAIRAFRRVPCAPKAARKMLDLYKDQSEDAEVRIYAYLGAMRCATKDIVSEVKSVLDKESVNQVGAFIWSHLKNMQETSAPLKQDIRDIVADLSLQKKFSTDLRKFSQFIEWSAFSERLNVGGDMEFSVIRSPKSFLPRFASLNVSTQMFGESLPVVEIGGHMQGLEHLFEKYFGNDGLLSNLKVEDLLKALGLGEDEDDDEDNDVDSNNRYSRSVSKFNRMNLLQERVNLRSEKEPKASLYLSLLGRKIARFTSQDLKEFLSVKEAFDVMEIFTQLAQKQKIERSMTVQFLDIELTLPSISGMKINLALNGTATAAIKIDGKFDVRKLFTSERNADIDGFMSPSAAVQVVAIMSIDSGVQKPGLKAVFNSHTSQTIEGKVEIKQGRVIDIKFNLPKDKIEVLSVSARLYTVEKDGQQKQIVSKKYYDIAGCTKALNKPLGIEFCSKVHVPNPLISENAPFVMALTDATWEVTLQKTDRSMRGYEFHLELPSAHDYDSMIYKLEFDTPSSTVNRHFALEAKINSKNQEHTANVKLSSPFKKIAGSASLVNRDEQKRVRVAFTVDDSKQYSFDSALKINRQSGRVEYQPTVTISYPRSEPISMEGTISYNLGRKQQYIIDLKANRPVNKPAFIKGTITKDGDFSPRNLQGKLRVSSDVSVSFPFLESRLHGTFDKQEAVMASDFSVEYKLQGYSRHSAKCVTKIQNHSTRYLSKLSILKELTSTQFPEYNNRLAWNFQHKPMEHLENEITLHYGENLDSEENKYHLLQVSKLEGVAEHVRRGKSEHHLQLEAPFLDHEIDFTANTEWDLIDKPKLDVKTDLKYGKDKHIQGSVLYSYKSAKPIEMQIEAKLVTPEREMIYQDTLRERSPNEFEGKTMVQWQRGQRATIDYVYRMKSDSAKTHHEVELKMKSPSMRIPMQQRALLRVTRDTINMNSHTQYDGRPVYSVEAKLTRDGESKIELKADDWEGELGFQNEEDTKEISLDIKSEKNDIHLIGSAKFEEDSSSSKRSVEVQGSYNVEQYPSQFFQFRSAVAKKQQRKPIQYSVTSSLKFGKSYSAAIRGDVARDIVEGPHDITIDFNGKRMKPVSVNLKHEIEDNSMTCFVRYLQNNEEKFQVTANGKYEGADEASWGVAIKSAYRPINGKEFHISYKKDEDTPKYNVNLRLQEAPGKPYNLNLEYTGEESRSLTKARAHALLTTPIAEYRSQEATLSGELARGSLIFHINAANAQGKRVQGNLNLNRHGDKATGSLELQLPLRNLRSVRINSVADYSDDYTAETQIMANGEKKAEWSLKYKNADKFYSQFKLMTAFGPKYQLNFDALADQKKKSFEHSFTEDGAEFSSSNMIFQKQGKNYNGHLQLKNDEWVGVVDLKNENRSPSDQLYTVSSRGFFEEPMTATFKIQHDNKIWTPELTICQVNKPSECLLAKATYSNKDKPYQKAIHRELEVKITQGSDLDLSFDIEHEFDKESFSQKFEVEAFGKQLGYEIELEDKDSDDKMTALLRVKMPSRQMLVKAESEATDEKLELSAEFLSDEIRQPSRKLEIEISHQVTEKDGADVVHSSLTVKHPVFERPIQMDLEIQVNEGEVLRPIQAKFAFDVTSDPSKKILVVAYLEKPNKDDSNITSFLNIYQADRRNLDIMVKGHFGSGDDRLTSGYEWHYAHDGQKYEGNSLMVIDNSEEEVHFYSRCPLHQFEAHGNWEYTKKQLFTLDINAKLDDDESEAKLSLDISKPCVELTLFAEPGKVSSRYHMCIDSEGRSLLTITAESYEGSEKQTDATISFDRRNGKTFSAHIHWRPEILGELMAEMMEMSDANIEFDTDKYLEHISDKVQLVARDFNKLVARPFGQFAVSEAKAINRELSADFREAGEYIERVLNYLPSWDEFVDSYVPETVQEYAKEVYEFFADFLNELTPFSCEYGSVCYKIRYAYNRHGFEGLVEYVYSAFENMPSGYYKLMITLKDYAVSHIELPHINWEPISEVYDDVYEWIQDTMEPIFNSRFVNQIQESASEFQEYVSENFDEVVEKVSVWADKYADELLETPEIKALYEALKSIFEDISKEFENLHLDQTASKIVDFSKDYFSKEALKDSVRVITMDPEHGKIEIEVKLPADATTLRNNLQSIRNPNSQDSQFETPSFKKVSKHLKGLHTAAKQEWVPPFKGHGQVVAGMHYKTFDNSFYDFAGQCSYLLAHDFEDGNFTVMVRYDGQDNNGNIDKSLIVILDDRVIEIDTNAETVKIDDQATELPINLKHVTIVRRGNTIVVDSRRGLSVTCNLVHDFCSTSISGWYYGKTAGLFGTYDNEQSNDMMRPKGHIDQNKEAFARSWEVAGNCKYRNLVREIEIDSESSEYDVCRDYFSSDDSPLSDCFGEVDEAEYLRMCIRQMAIQRNPTEAVCGIAAAYADVCESRKVDVTMPSSCMKCESVEGEKIASGDRQTSRDNPQSADVVFIIEERQCNRAIVKDIDSVARLVDRELLNSGYNNNRFGVVAFAGKQGEQQAHSHTARGKLFFESKDLVLATEKIEFIQKKGQSDAFSAIKFAIRYPFRAGVSKTFILLTCSQCDEDYMKVDYSDIQTLLLEHGIILHTLSPRDIQVRGSVSKSKGIYGVDANTVFRGRDVSQKELQGTPDLRAQVAVPKDVCVALAQEVHGSFFTTKPVEGQQPSESKNWKSLLARRIALTAQPHECQKCDCESTDDNVPHTVCKPCKAPAPKVPVKSYVEDSDEE